MVTKREIDELPVMVRWFDPSVIKKILKPVFISAIFGEYADRRLIQAALDDALPDQYLKRADIRTQFQQDTEGAIWCDFAADLGDGFDSTYAIASLLAQKELSFFNQKTERGSVLIFGGDQVYPDSTLDNYTRQFKLPYEWALPDQVGDDDAWHPRIYAIPGNHDWYDGLNVFTALFCGHKDWKVGNWRAKQERSYFALQLTDRVWLWGIDIQLSERVDQPQAAYFRKIAADMDEHSEIILCTAVPGWYGADNDKDKAFSAMGYFASSIVLKAKRDHRIALVLSGDTHHYCRYQAKTNDTMFITSGGGGAFLHPTHPLKNEIPCQWWAGKADKFTLSRVENAGILPANQPACYPDRKESKKLLGENIWFPFFNWKFTLMVGVIYSALGLLSIMHSELSDPFTAIKNPVWIVAALGLIAVYVRYADRSTWLYDGARIAQPESPFLRKVFTGLPHAAVQICVLTIISQSVYLELTGSRGLLFWSWSFNAAFILVATFLNGIIGSFLFGMYLNFTCRSLGINANDSYSAMSLNSHRHFLRLKILADKIVVFPVGLHEIPKRTDWRVNPQTISDSTASLVIPKKPLVPKLIEGPIEIKLRPVALI